MKATRRSTWLVVVLLAGAGAYAYYRTRSPADGNAITFETVAVDRGAVVSKITSSGTLSALVTVQVGSQVSGRLRDVLVDWNAEVTKGQVLARIDPQLFRASLEQARANAAAASANLARAEVQALEAARQYARTKSLTDQKFVAAADADTAEAGAGAAKAQVAAARAAVQQAQAALHQAQVNLDYTTITSPINGVVISRSVDVGQTVAASLQAPTLFVIAEDLRKMQVDASVSEADVGKLQSGMAATFTVDAFPGEKFVGAIRQIRNAPQTLQNVVTYNAVINVANPELKLRPGMTASVTFVNAQRPNVLRVRNAALRFRPSPEILTRLRTAGKAKTAGSSGAVKSAQPTQAGSPVSPQANDDPAQRTVWLLKDGKPVPVPIRVGISDGTLTELVDGRLAEGDALITDALEPKPSGARPSTPGRSPFRMF